MIVFTSYVGKLCVVHVLIVLFWMSGFPPEPRMTGMLYIGFAYLKMVMLVHCKLFSCQGNILYLTFFLWNKTKVNFI